MIYQKVKRFTAKMFHTSLALVIISALVFLTVMANQGCSFLKSVRISATFEIAGPGFVAWCTGATDLALADIQFDDCDIQLLDNKQTKSASVTVEGFKNTLVQCSTGRVKGEKVFTKGCRWIQPK